MKKVMVIIPHEDDELNITGGILLNKDFDKNNCYVVFMTNGDYETSCQTRVTEALRSCKVLGIPSDNVIFMGYADQYYNANTHIYHTRNDIFTSASGHKETYCLKKDEFHYKKYKKHCEYNYDNLLNDFLLLIKEYTPDIFYVIDFDSHPDHRCCSLTFEKALGIYLKENNSYSPLVYKGFAYATAYRGKNDFDNINLESTKFMTEDNSLAECENPYYKWKDRVRFPVALTARKKLFWFNKWYLAIKKHRSQITLLRNCKSIINNDQIFWQRRTDNVALTSHIKATSGDVKYVNDFMFFDCENILNGNKTKPVLLDNAWIPDKNDNEKTLLFEFDEPKDINFIRFYQNFNSPKYITKILVESSNGYCQEFNLENSISSSIICNQNDIKWLKIKIIEKTNGKQGFSEIELLPKNKNDNCFIKILNNDDFVYDKYYFEKLNINVYFYDGYYSHYLKPEDCIFYKNGQEISYKDLQENHNKKFLLKVCLKNNHQIYTEALFKRISSFNIFTTSLIKFFNNQILSIDVFYNRVVNKLKKIIKGII